VRERITSALVCQSVRVQQVTILEPSDIDAAIAPLAAQVAALEARVFKLEAAPVPPPSGDLPGWVLIFEDTFGVDVPLGSFPPAGGKWGAYPPSYKDTSGNGVYDAARTVQVAGGVMRIHLYTDVGGVCRVAAPVPYIRPPSATVKWPGQLYGRYETVARFPTLGAGYKVAWLLWPDSGTNTTGSPSGVGGNGEIDFPEHGLGQQIATSGFMHRQDATVGNDQYQANSPVDLRGFHSFVTEWSKDLCRFLIDGREIGRTTERVPRTSMHWVLQCETQLSGGKPLASAVADIEIDAVRVWRPA
jgi:hypothetical protein